MFLLKVWLFKIVKKNIILLFFPIYILVEHLFLIKRTKKSEIKFTLKKEASIISRSSTNNEIL